MKNIIFAFVLVFALNSCCTKKECSDNEYINKLEFIDYNISDIDSVSIIQNTDNSFNQTIFYKNKLTEQNGNIYLEFKPKYFNLNSTYSIQIYNTGDFFIIDNFTFEQKKCNTGFFCFDNYIHLNTYEINGYKVEHKENNYTDIISLVKP